MSLITRITSNSPGMPTANLMLYRSAAAVATPVGQIAYRQLQEALKSGSLIASQRAYNALQQAAAASRAAAHEVTPRDSRS